MISDYERKQNEKVIHKTGLKKIVKYLDLGVYTSIPTPLCVGLGPVYDGKRLWVHRMWKYVTCKHCLKKREKGLVK
jgi:hypothetical protein